MTERIKKYKALLLLLGGALTAMTMLIPKIGIIEWLSLSPAILVFLVLVNDKSVKFRTLFFNSMLFTGPFYFMNFYWLLYMHTTLESSNSPTGAWLLATFMFIAVSGIYMVFGSLAILAFGLLARSRFSQKYKFIQPLLFACVWTVFEWTQTFGWWGVPWAKLALGQIEMLTMIQSASLFGSYFVGFLILLVNSYFAMALISPNKKKIAAFICVAVILCNFSFGAVKTLTYKDEGEPIKAAAIQGNLSSAEKWGADKLEKSKQAYGGLSKDAADEGATLIVWPETALPYVLLDSQSLTEFVTGVAKETNTTMLVSAFYETNDPYNLYNSIFEVDSNGEFGDSVYHKKHLVPFGEFVPMRDLFMTICPPLANVGMVDQDISSGNDTSIMDTEYGKIGSEVCFDSIYENVTIEAVRDGAQLITVSTNDSWFKDSAAVYMHNSQSKLRAIESGRYIIRAANTGISSIIKPTGESIADKAPLVTGYVIGDVYLSDTITPYVLWGNIFVYICIAFTAFLLIWHIVVVIVEKKLKRDAV